MNAALGVFSSFFLVNQIGMTEAGSVFLFVSTIFLFGSLTKFGMDTFLLSKSGVSRKDLWSQVLWVVLINAVVMDLILYLLIEVLTQKSIYVTESIYLIVPIFALIQILSVEYQIRKKFFAYNVVNGIAINTLIGLSALIDAVYLNFEIIALALYTILLSSMCLCDCGLSLRRPNVRALSTIYSELRVFGITGAMAAVITQAPIYITGLFFTNREVAELSIFNKIASVYLVLLAGINTYAAPRFRVLHGSNKKKLWKFFYSVTGISFYLSSVCTLIIIISHEFLFQLIGVSELQAIFGFYTLVFSQFINLSTGPSAYLLQLTGNAAYYRNLNFTVAIVYVPVLIYFAVFNYFVGFVVFISFQLVLTNLLSFLRAIRSIRSVL